MDENRHTTDTRIEKIVPVLFGSRRPKIWLRRCTDPKAKLAIRTYDLNRNSEAEGFALVNLRKALS